MDRDKGNPKNGTFWGFRGGGYFFGTPGVPPLLWRGGPGFPISRTRFRDPLWGFRFGPLQTGRRVKHRGPKKRNSKLCLHLSVLCRFLDPSKNRQLTDQLAKSGSDTKMCFRVLNVLFKCCFWVFV